MITISPSLLACDFLNIESELKAFEGFTDLWFHLDIMDSHFVPNLTFGHPIVNLISKKTSIPLDAHFMVTNPEFYIETFKDYNIHNFTFHYEACENPMELILEAKKIYPSVGLSIKPGTDVSVLTDEILKELDLVLIMSVEPGFGGQSFIESTYDKVEYLNNKKSELKKKFVIQIDGGVKDINSKQLISAGADNLVAGSYVFKDGPSTYKSKVESLRN
ncbi:ribulose-phosphate 3-epimerase [Halobacteriovorax marinus]|uniref:Ribulose-phosphate 3-epimerase n=1 Tax=Halobacteriovorax marinus TaxID=97084 RepID=A0A1Y5F1X3_9BACT|nr:ribulose-phosphate 3-epimerase [Halobacteriovorax marinus]